MCHGLCAGIGHQFTCHQGQQDQGKAATWMHCLKVPDSADEAKKKRKMAGLWFLRVDWDGKKEDAGRGEEGRGGQEGVGFTPEPPLPRYRATAPSE